MEWVIFKTFDARANADILSEKLESEGVPSKIDAGLLASGIEGFNLFVPKDLLHRAKWLNSDDNFTGEELNYLATGKLDKGE